VGSSAGRAPGPEVQAHPGAGRCPQPRITQGVILSPDETINDLINYGRA
jgi:hypothetical protein